MTTSSDSRHLLVGYDGSPDAAGAIEIGARLLPGSAATIAHMWAPPFTQVELRARISRRTATVQEMMEVLEREALAEAERVAGEGVTLAKAAGWRAEPLVVRSYGGEGLQLAVLAEERRPDAAVVGSRGLTGVRAALGSVSDHLVHAARCPVLVVPRFILSTDRAAADDGPVLVGDDGSEGAEHARVAAGALFGRTVVPATVDEGPTARAVADRLVRRAQEAGAGVIAVGSRGRSAPREMLLGSVAMAVLHHADRPVLVVPGRAS